MITSLYNGGLGNQMFQVVTGYALAKENNDTYRINPSLQQGIGQGNPIRTYIDTMFKNIEKTDHKSSNYYIEPQFNYSKIPYKEDLLLDGYFISEKYFLNYKDELNKLFEFECSEEPTNECVIHIRTGDHLIGRGANATPTNFHIITPNYFEKAIQQVLELNPSVSFKIISDERESANRFIPEYIKYEFVSDDELTDLKTISRCDYAIISNSTFSWWGSYLGKKKITFMPNRWYRKLEYDMSDSFRDDMITISP